MFPFVTAVARKAQTPVTPTCLRVVLWYWDVLAAARTGVTRTGQSGDGIGFEEAKCMQWHGKGSGIQCTLLAPGR